MIFEHASVIDCHQDGIFPDPESWILAWIILSFISSINFLSILCIANKLKLLETLSDKMTRLKGSFVSFTILSFITLVYYFLRIVNKGLNGLNGATSFFLFIWPIVMWIVVWILNYTPKVCCKDCPFIICLFYWIALVMYFLETLFKLFAAMLDVAYDVAPAIEGQFSDESLKGGVVILNGFRLAFHTRLVLFFWDKMFHGDKDLFTEPCSKLKATTTSTQTEEEAAPTLTNAEESSASTATKPDKTPPPTSPKPGNPPAATLTDAAGQPETTSNPNV
jgi:hypothetical protein